MYVLRFAYFLNTEWWYVCCICKLVCMFVCLCTCCFSRLCVSFRRVMLCTPLRSLSSKAARARVNLDDDGMHVCPVSRLIASY